MAADAGPSTPTTSITPPPYSEREDRLRISLQNSVLPYKIKTLLWSPFIILERLWDPKFPSVALQQPSIQRLASPGKSRNPSLCVGADEEAGGSASIRLDDSEEKGGDDHDQATVKTAASTTRLVLQDTSTVLHERIPILPVLTFVVLYIFCGAGNLRNKMQC